MGFLVMGAMGSKVLHEPPRLEIFWVWLPVFRQATFGQPFGPMFGKLAPAFGL